MRSSGDLGAVVGRWRVRWHALCTQVLTGTVVGDRTTGTPGGLPPHRHPLAGHGDVVGDVIVVSAGDVNTDHLR